MSGARRLPPGRGAAIAGQVRSVPQPGPGPGDAAQRGAALPLEAVERMAELCLRGEEEEEEEEDEEEEEEELMAELQEVLGEEPGGEARPEPPAESLQEETPPEGAAGRGHSSALAPSPVPSASPPPGAHPPEPPALPSSSADAPSGPSHPGGAGTEAMLLRHQRGYKLLALQVKQRGDMEAAARAYRTAKSFDALLEAAAKGQPLEPGTVPPPPEPLPEEPPSPAQPPVGTAGPEAMPAAVPRDLLEALQQRMERYQEAASGARARGEERKARMHQRIAKQYQDAIRAHQAGRAVDLSELPVPPGFQPIPGMEAPGGHQSLAGVLEAAMKLAKQEDQEEEDGTQEDGTQEDGTQEAKPPVPQACQAQPSARPALPTATSSCQPKPPPARATPGVPQPAPKTTARGTKVPGGGL